jgi:hypothetical protein
LYTLNESRALGDVVTGEGGDESKMILKDISGVNGRRERCGGLRVSIEEVDPQLEQEQEQREPKHRKGQPTTAVSGVYERLVLITSDFL